MNNLTCETREYGTTILFHKEKKSTKEFLISKLIAYSPSTNTRPTVRFKSLNTH